MEKKKKQTLTKKEQQLEWLKNEIEKDAIELENEKKKFIDQIKKIKKEEITQPKKEIKLTLWKKIKKVILGI
jgi:hypothetical protein